MNIHVINSNSKGNGYILQSSDNKVLLIEAGVRLAKVKEALDFDISGIQGLIASHSHMDHLQFAEDYLKSGITVYTSLDAIQESGIKSHNFQYIEPKHRYFIGDYSVVPFDLVHDVRNYGFLIHHPEMGLTCFITDTHYCPYTFPNLNQAIIEANHDIDIVDAQLLEGKGNVFVRNRSLSGHMEFQTTKKFLKANNLSKVVNILLIHLSDSGSDEDRFVNEIRELTGKSTFAAKAGMTIPFDKTPF